MMKKSLFCMLCFIALSVSGQAQIKTWFVRSSANGTGTSWATAGELQSVIDGASAGDSIFVEGGSYLPSTSYSMKEGVKIYGSFAGTESSLNMRKLNANIAAGNGSILEGNGNTVVFNNGNQLTGAAVLDGFTITNGTGSSGGIGNSYGGGMYNNSASPTLSNLVFKNNTGTNGGGIFNNVSSPAISNVTFVNNRVQGGSGGSYGGGLTNNNHSSPILTNVTFIGNTASDFGGAIENTTSSPTLINITFVNNSVQGAGGGAVDNFSGSSPKLSNCIFWGNVATTSADIYQEDGSCAVSYSYTQTSQIGTGNITGSVNPFVNSSNPAGGDGIYGTADDGLELAGGSQAIDAGDPLTNGSGYSIQASNIDIAGNIRIINNHIDMGAYESNSTVLPVILGPFTGNIKNGIASLQWRTGVEIGFNDFELQVSSHIEASSGGSGSAGSSGNFNTIAKVLSKGSNSNYSYNTPQTWATAYYRLKMVLNDGSSKYSDVVTLVQDKSIDNILIYPSPAKDYIDVDVTERSELVIYDASARLVKRASLHAGVNRIVINNLVAGMYYGVVNGTKLSFVKE